MKRLSAMTVALLFAAPFAHAADVGVETFLQNGQSAAAVASAVAEFSLCQSSLTFDAFVFGEDLDLADYPAFHVGDLEPTHVLSIGCSDLGHQASVSIAFIDVDKELAPLFFVRLP